MAKAKKTKEPKEAIDTGEKKSSIFDFISFLTDKKKPWSELTTEEQKLFNPYMINRFLSMDLFLLEAVNELQKYTVGSMEKQDVYSLYYHFLPKQRFFLKYIKSQKEAPEKEINMLIKYFNVSRRECEEYYQILSNNEKGQELLTEIKRNFQYVKF